MRRLSANSVEVLGIRPNGSESKVWIVENEIKKLLKVQKRDWSNIYSEHYASKFINITGGNSHITEIVDISEITNKDLNMKTIGVLCEDFTVGGSELISYVENSSSIETDIDQHRYYFDDINYILSKTQGVEFEDVSFGFWSMYIYDTILGNFDRHAGNWGLLKKGKNKIFSPIFDNGGSLLPRADFKVIYTDTDENENEKEWFKRRVYEFPTSKIMFKRISDPDFRERSNYYEVWNSNIIPEEMKNIFKGWNIEKILDDLLNEDNLEDNQKNFYRKYITLRYRCIIGGEDFDEVWEDLERRSKDILSWI